MGRFIGGLCLVVFGGILGYAVAKAEDDRDNVERAYRKVKRSAQDAIDKLREEHPEEASKIDDACQQVASEFKRFKGKVKQVFAEG
jgi:vacuolar-type H+-ATPase subunit H